MNYIKMLAEAPPIPGKLELMMAAKDDSSLQAIIEALYAAGNLAMLTELCSKYEPKVESERSNVTTYTISGGQVTFNYGTIRYGSTGQAGGGVKRQAQAGAEGSKKSSSSTDRALWVLRDDEKAFLKDEWAKVFSTVKTSGDAPCPKADSAYVQVKLTGRAIEKALGSEANCVALFAPGQTEPQGKPELVAVHTDRLNYGSSKAGYWLFTRSTYDLAVKEGLITVEPTPDAAPEATPDADPGAQNSSPGAADVSDADPISNDSSAAADSSSPPGNLFDSLNLNDILQ
jgi:hypothetical protein